MKAGTATVARVDTVLDILGSDHLQVARLGDYYSVVDKNTVSPGQLAVFITEHCVLPNSLIEAMGATGKLSGKQGKTVRFRELCGYISQGVLYPVDSGDGEPFITIPTDDGVGVYQPVHEGQDVTELLGITPSSHLLFSKVPF
jgi:hypothetical protein